MIDEKIMEIVYAIRDRIDESMRTIEYELERNSLSSETRRHALSTLEAQRDVVYEIQEALGDYVG